MDRFGLERFIQRPNVEWVPHSVRHHFSLQISPAISLCIMFLALSMEIPISTMWKFLFWFVLAAGSIWLYSWQVPWRSGCTSKVTDLFDITGWRSLALILFSYLLHVIYRTAMATSYNIDICSWLRVVDLGSWFRCEYRSPNVNSLNICEKLYESSLTIYFTVTHCAVGNIHCKSLRQES